MIMRVKAGAKPFDPVASLLHGLLLATLLLPLVEPGKFKYVECKVSLTLPDISTLMSEFIAPNWF